MAVDPPLAGARGAARVGSRRGDGGARGRQRARVAAAAGAESLHLTLCFLGSRPVGEIEALAAALARLRRARL